MLFSKKALLTASVLAFLGGLTSVSAASYTTSQVLSGGTVTYDDGSTIDVYHNSDADGFKISGKTGTVNIGNDGKGTVHIKTESSTTGNSLSNGIWVDENSQLTVNGNLDISSVYGGSCFANGLAILNMGTGEGTYSSLTVNGDVTIGDPKKQDSLTETGSSYENSEDKNWGVNAAEIHGGYGPDGHVIGQADDYTGARWAPTGVSITCNGKGSTIDLNGSLYLSLRGTGLKVDPYYQAEGRTSYDIATINVNQGDVTIFTPESDHESYHVAASYGGTINVNMNDARTAGAGHNVVLQGNLLSMKDYNNMGQPYFYQDGRINLALDTKNSSWIGIVDNSGVDFAGEVNLWLQNEAVWHHRSPSVVDGLQVKTMPSPSINHYGIYDGVSHVTSLHGGADEDSAGYIFADSSAKMQIGNYAGYTNVYYAHNGNGEATSDYTGGDITIGNAAVGSFISLITDNSGIDMTNTTSVANVLNALAGKLTYSAYASGERNLSGYVRIAEGLTSSAAYLKTGNLSFTDAGKGSYIKGDDPDEDTQTETNYTTALNGSMAENQQYVDGGVMTEDGAYKFTKATTITVDEGAAILCTDRDITINAKRTTLSAKSTAEDGSGMEIAVQKKLTFTGNTLSTEGNIGANVEGHLSVEGDFKATGTEMGLLASGGADVQITGATEAKAPVAVSATGENTVVTLTGALTATAATEETTAEKGIAVSADTGATVKQEKGSVTLTGDILADGGTIAIHGDGVSENKVNIKGDLHVSNDGNLSVDIIGKGSAMSGGYDLKSGNLTVQAYNGATWTVTDIAKDEAKTVSLFRDESTESTGALKLVGGTAQDMAGNLAMEKTEDMTVSDYSGWWNVYYTHENKGQNATDYKAGHIILKNVAAGSGLILSTNDSLDETEKGLESAVEKVFIALAPKLQVTGNYTQQTNLTGKLLSLYSPSGLTASAVEAEGQYYLDEYGYGQYSFGSVKIKSAEVDYETFVMKGVRSAATVSIHSWRDNSQDFYRASEFADENGIFAKVLGGKTKSDVRGISADSSYKGIQVGYDKMLKNGWHTGVAFDYRDGSSDYLLGGTGKDKLYSLGVYAKRPLEDNRYLHVAAKIGRVQNEYDVFTESRLQSLHGDYNATAYALSAEYGKVYAKGNTYITPKVQLTWSHVGGSDYTGETTQQKLMNVYQDAYQSFLGRVGIEAGMKKEKAAYYAGLYFAHEFSGGVNARYYASDGGWKSTKFDGNDSWAELILGGHYQAGDRTQIYADFARDFGGDFEHTWKLDAGVRYSF